MKLAITEYDCFLSYRVIKAFLRVNIYNMNDYKLIAVKNLTIDDHILSIGAENPFLTKSDDITKILSSSVMTKIEIFPTNIDIPSGTIDSKSNLCSLFNWSENGYDD